MWPWQLKKRLGFSSLLGGLFKACLHVVPATDSFVQATTVQPFMFLCLDRHRKLWPTIHFTIRDSDDDHDEDDDHDDSYMYALPFLPQKTQSNLK